MKDIDFDELDRAVSSVLGQGSSKDDSVNEPATEPMASDEKTENQPEKNTDSGDEPSVTPAPAPPAPSLATKRRGKFMDVMHPSADMNPAAASPKSPRTIAPLTPVTPTAEAPEAEPKPVEEPTPIVEHPTEPTASLDESHSLIGAEPAPVESMLPEHVESSEVEDSTLDAVVDTEEQTEKSDDVATVLSDDEDSEKPTASLYVDPIGAASTEPDASETPVAEESVSDLVESQDESPAQPTPFLTDTKVDKRPLGAFGETESAAIGGVDEAMSTTPAAVTPTDTQGAPTVPLPRELQPDVVGVESTQESDTVQATSELAATLASGTTTPHDDGRVEGHPLFDTSTYHEPIAAVHGNGMPGWAKWLIGLLVCLALGAGVGYFLFTAGL